MKFHKDLLINHVFIIFDVDGVVRDSIETPADPRFIQKVKSLLKTFPVDVAFLSGTPVTNDPTLEPWRRGNAPLTAVFSDTFERELKEGKVAIYGMLGGHQMKPGGKVEVRDAYPIETTFELGKIVTQAFFNEILLEGSSEQQRVARQVQKELEDLQLTDSDQPSDATAKEFSPIVKTIHQHLDPEFRLVSNGATVETQVFSPLYNPARALKFVKEKINKTAHIATGLAKKADLEFHFLLISKTHKGHTAKQIIQDKLKIFPDTLVITVGDTQIDFPMHEHAHLAFHVGVTPVFEAYKFPHCVLVRGPQGEDKQLVEGTLKILDLIEAGIGKPFYDLKHIPQKNALGIWEYQSLREIDPLNPLYFY